MVVATAAELMRKAGGRWRSMSAPKVQVMKSGSSN